MNEEQTLEASPLGNDTAYVNEYDASLLFPIARQLNWQTRGIERGALPIKGEDIWNGYEVSWLNSKGKPVVRVARFHIPASSQNIIESKSFKLYLNSFNLSRFETEQLVIDAMTRDLSAAAGAPVAVFLQYPDALEEIKPLEGVCIDELDIEVEHYAPDASLLTTTADQPVEETLYSHLLKSNCPVTGQPDWASIVVAYKGKPISREGLLQYVISYREHGDFHEQCVENIFMDIWERCEPEELSVYARYLRRGGLDINPFRSNHLESAPHNRRLGRQ